MVQSSWCHCHRNISCFVKIQIGLTFLVLPYPGCPGKEAVKQVSWCLCLALAFHIGLTQCTVSPFLPASGLTTRATHAAVQGNTSTTSTLLYHPFLQLGTQTGDEWQVTHLQELELHKHTTTHVTPLNPNTKKTQLAWTHGAEKQRQHCTANKHYSPQLHLTSSSAVTKGQPDSHSFVRSLLRAEVQPGLQCEDRQ